VLLKLLLVAMLLGAGVARADSSLTRDALDRLDELLELRVQDGLLDPQELAPAILVSARPRLEGSESWYATRVISLLEARLGPGNLRLCEACMAPRTFVRDGTLSYQTGPVGLDEVAWLDDAGRGSSPPARAAIWVDEFRGGVSIRIVDIASGRVIYARNVDPLMIEDANTARSHALAAELERRARGDSITQAFVDLALYPGQHISVDWTEQWGPTNHNLSGFTISLYDPVVGLGASHYRALKLWDILVGAKLLVSLPTAVARAFDDTGDVIDPMITAVAVTRVPFGRSNYGAVLTISTNGEVGLGISLLNISLLPVLP
jgi:hypothetical protein